jgi:proline racemase
MTTNKKITYSPPADWMKIQTIEMHTGGEPVRIITEGLPEIKGKTMLEKRRYFRKNLDFIRTGILFEPRGHSDMYGAIITPPVTPDGDFGAIFMHNEGYSTMCGHATLALARLAFDTGIVHADRRKEVRIDGPAGRLTARAHFEHGSITGTSFLNVPSFVLLKNEVVRVPRLGIVHFDIAYGGAFYAICQADTLRLKLTPASYRKLVTHGMAIKKAVMKHFKVVHPYEEDLGFLYGTIFTAKAENPSNHSRNVCIFANGEVDRSATGSGVSARAALHYTHGELETGKKITIESIIGTTMDISIKEAIRYAEFDAVIPEVSGESYYTGRGEYWFDPNDPLKHGFLVR